MNLAIKTSEAELLEKRYWRAIQDQDVDVAMRLTDEPCILTGAQGIGLIDRKTLAALKSRVIDNATAGRSAADCPAR